MSDFDTLSLRQTLDCGNKIGGAERAKRFMSGELVLVERSEAQKRGVVLAFERNVSIAACRFVASESFTKSNTKVKFGYIDERLLKLFGKTREDMPAGEISIHTLLEYKHDPEIMVALGLQSVRFTKLGQFYQMIEVQGYGQEGPLLVNGYANIAYIIDENGAPWAVSADLDGDGWDFLALPLGRPRRWGGGGQVFSRKLPRDSVFGSLGSRSGDGVSHCRTVLFC